MESEKFRRGIRNPASLKMGSVYWHTGIGVYWRWWQANKCHVSSWEWWLLPSGGVEIGRSHSRAGLNPPQWRGHTQPVAELFRIASKA